MGQYITHALAAFHPRPFGETSVEIPLPHTLSVIIVALPFALVALVCLTIGFRYITRFFGLPYLGTTRDRFKDIFFGTLFFSLGATSLIPLFFLVASKTFSWSFILISLCLAALLLPIGILGAYWQSYLANKLWGGLPQAGGPPVSTKQAAAARSIDPARLKVPRRTFSIAALAAVISFFGLFMLLASIPWNGSQWVRWTFVTLGSGFFAFSVLMTIYSAAFSRRIKKIWDEGSSPDINE